MFWNVWEDGRAILLGVVFLVKEGVFWNIWEDRIVFLVMEGHVLECMRIIKEGNVPEYRAGRCPFLS